MKLGIINSSKTVVIAFSGYNQRALFAFFRTLDNNGIDYAIIAKDSDDTVFKSKYKDKVVAVRRVKKMDIEDLTECLDKTRKKYNSDNIFIAPSTEALNRYLLEHRRMLENQGCIIPLVSKEFYENISDKYAFNLLCEKYKILVPMRYKNFDEAKIPFVAKPYNYFTAENNIFSPQLIYSEEDKNCFHTKFLTTDFFYQPIIEGSSFYLLYYFDQNKNVYKYSQQNILQQANGKSIISAISSDLHTKEISNRYEQMFIDIGFRGLVMIEIRENNGIYYMIEANPRFWGPSQLFVDANMNFFEAFLYDYGITSNKPDFSNSNNAKYFWHGGMLEDERNKVLFVNHSPQMHFDMEDWKKIDVHNREDTMQIFNAEIMESEKEKLLELYAKNSKHSNYQIMPRYLKAILGESEVVVNSRYEKERLAYIFQNVDVSGKMLVDIGGNSGYFSFEMIDAGASKVFYFEGNKAHSDFVELAAKALNINNKILVNNRYFSFKDELSNLKVDIVLLLNVLHHLGDDYGDKSISIQKAKDEIAAQLNSLADKTNILIFQLGFNWKGDRNFCLFENGTKQELIDYVKQAVSNNYEILSIGIAQKENGIVHYEDLNENNIKRDDSLGEFLNRPLFIMKSKRFA